MKKIIKIFICALCIMSLLTACNYNEIKAENITTGENVEYNKDYGANGKKTAFEFLLYDYSYADINYNVKNLQKNKFYEISTRVCSSELYCNNPENGIKIKSNDVNDITSSFIYSNVVSSDTDNGTELEWTKLSKIVYSYNGQIDFSILLGEEDSKIKGDVSVDEPEVKMIDESDEYKIISSTDKSVNTVFLTSDLKKYKVSDKSVINYLNFLSKCRKSLVTLVASDYTYGKTNYVFTQDIADFGNAGYPVYIDRKQISDVLGTISNFDSNGECDIITFALIHEMSHTFDRICGEKTDRAWQFDSEFWANLKTFYVLDSLKIKQSRDVINRFNTDYVKNNNVYSSDYFAKRFFDICSDDNWKTLKNTLKDYNEIENINCKNDKEKFNKFEQIYNKNAKQKLNNEFNDNEWKIIENHFNR